MKNKSDSKTSKMKWAISMDREPGSQELTAVVTAWEPRKRQPKDPGKTRKQTDLAPLYLSRGKDPESFARAVFGEIRKRVLESRGLLRQRMDLVESLSNCLFDKYLAGNTRLRRALTSRHRRRIHEEILRTINAVVSIAKKRTLKTLKEDLVFMSELPDILVEHPRDMSLSEIPTDLKMEMARKAIEASREEIGDKTANLLCKILDHCFPLSVVASEEGVTRQAIHMRLAPAIKKVRSQLDRIELPRLGS